MLFVRRVFYTWLNCFELMHGRISLHDIPYLTNISKPKLLGVKIRQTGSVFL